MLYRNSSQYALRALTHMAGLNSGSCQRIADLAEAQNIPQAYLSQIFKQLVEGKILKSIKGPGGGYVFARAPEKITFYDIKICVDGPDDFEKCVIGFDVCSDHTLCPAHEAWKKQKVQAQKDMCSINLASASELVRKKHAEQNLAAQKTRRRRL